MIFLLSADILDSLSNEAIRMLAAQYLEQQKDTLPNGDVPDHEVLPKMEDNNAQTRNSQRQMQQKFKSPSNTRQGKVLVWL